MGSTPSGPSGSETRDLITRSQPYLVYRQIRHHKQRTARLWDDTAVERRARHERADQEHQRSGHRRGHRRRACLLRLVHDWRRSETRQCVPTTSLLVGTFKAARWQTREEYIAVCLEGASEAGEYVLRIPGMSFEGTRRSSGMPPSSAASTSATICPWLRTLALGASSTRPNARTRPVEPPPDRHRCPPWSEARLGDPGRVRHLSRHILRGGAAASLVGYSDQTRSPEAPFSSTRNRRCESVRGGAGRGGCNGAQVSADIVHIESPKPSATLVDEAETESASPSIVTPG